MQILMHNGRKLRDEEKKGFNYTMKILIKIFRDENPNSLRETQKKVKRKQNKLRYKYTPLVVGDELMSSVELN